MKKLTFALTMIVGLAILSTPALAWWDWDEGQYVLPRKEYTHKEMFKKLNLTEEQTKLLKAHREAVAEEYHKGLFSILTRKQIKKRAKLIEKFAKERRQIREKINAKLEKIKDEAERKAKYDEYVEYTEWLQYVRHYFFEKDVKPLRRAIHKLLRDNNNDPDPCMKQLNKLRRKIDKVRAHYFRWDVRCRLDLSWLQRKMLAERDKLRHDNWEAGLKDILTEEQYAYLQVLRKERADFYKGQGDKFKKKLDKLLKEHGEDWNPFKGGKGLGKPAWDEPGEGNGKK